MESPSRAYTRRDRMAVHGANGKSDESERMNRRSIPIDPFKRGFGLPSR